MQVVGAEVFRPSFAGTLAESWVGSGVARTRTFALTGCFVEGGLNSHATVPVPESFLFNVYFHQLKAERD